MSQPVTLRDGTARDLAEAEQWYEEREPGVGERLVERFREALAEVARNPEVWPPVFTVRGRAVRRMWLRPFPYALYFRVEPAEIVVFLLFHGSRDPKALRRELRSRD